MKNFCDFAIGIKDDYEIFAGLKERFDDIIYDADTLNDNPDREDRREELQKDWEHFTFDCEDNGFNPEEVFFYFAVGRHL